MATVYLAEDLKHGRKVAIKVLRAELAAVLGAERFLADYATHPERYVASALPDLPFADDAFDLTLSANLLFLYDDRLEEGFHHEAMAELSRVTDGEVRVFTLASLDRERSEFVEPVVERLRADGHGVEFREVPYEFQPGATEMLVVEAG
jgi:hypothetical protein